MIWNFACLGEVRPVAKLNSLQRSYDLAQQTYIEPMARLSLALSGAGQSMRRGYFLKRSEDF